MKGTTVSRRNFMQVAGATVLGACPALRAFASPAPANTSPNIIFIIADDVGYGDLGCYGAQKVQTPNLDRLAGGGIRFTDAHVTSSVCTPSRYSVLTGQYAWRNRDGDHILSGVAPLSIAPTTPTVASVLKSAGYATGLVGKWHLGLGTKEKPVDYNGEIAPGPLELGFDSVFYYPATNDRTPCIYIEGRRVVGLDPSDPITVNYEQKVGNDATGAENPELLKMKSDASHSKTIVNGISRIGYMSGGKTARWVDEDMADTFVGKAVSFMEKNKDNKFFLYFAPHAIHEPMAPHPRFKGTSGCGTRGDAIHELDWMVGEIMNTLDRLGIADNTLIVFTSDNGGAIKDTYDDGTNAEHAKQPPNGNLRNFKGSLYEGGHRIPCIARWPRKIGVGKVSDALIGMIDMMATFAAAAGRELPPGASPDGVNVLPALVDGKGGYSVRRNLVLHGNGNSPLALREGPWVLVTRNRENTAKPELYNLDTDPEQKNDLSKKERKRVKKLGDALRKIQEGR